MDRNTQLPYVADAATRNGMRAPTFGHQLNCGTRSGCGPNLCWDRKYPMGTIAKIACGDFLELTNRRGFALASAKPLRGRLAGEPNSPLRPAPVPDAVSIPAAATARIKNKGPVLAHGAFVFNPVGRRQPN